jgi:hypothetical protein
MLRRSCDVTTPRKWEAVRRTDGPLKLQSDSCVDPRRTSPARRAMKKQKALRESRRALGAEPGCLSR